MFKRESCIKKEVSLVGHQCPSRLSNKTNPDAKGTINVSNWSHKLLWGDLLLVTHLDQKVCPAHKPEDLSFQPDVPGMRKPRKALRFSPWAGPSCFCLVAFHWEEGGHRTEGDATDKQPCGHTAPAGPGAPGEGPFRLAGPSLDQKHSQARPPNAGNITETLAVTQAREGPYCP